MRTLIGYLATFLRTQKKYIFLSLVFALILLVWMFPYGDMSDYVIGEVAKNTSNQVILQFDDMAVGFLPPSLTFEKVEVNNPVVAPIKADVLRIAPSIASFLAFSPGVNISAEGFWKGDIDAQIKQTSIKDSEAPAFELKATIENLDISQISKFFNLPIKPEGNVSLAVDPILIDSSFRKSPETRDKGDDKGFRIEGYKIVIPKSRVSWFDIPRVQVSSLRGSGRINPGRILINELLIGSQGKDDLVGKMKGTIDVQFQQLDGAVRMIPSSASFKIDIRLEREVLATLKPFLSIAEKYKSRVGGGDRYILQVDGNFSGGNFVPGNISPTGPF